MPLIIFPFCVKVTCTITSMVRTKSSSKKKFCALAISESGETTEIETVRNTNQRQAVRKIYCKDSF